MSLLLLFQGASDPQQDVLLRKGTSASISSTVFTLAFAASTLVGTSALGTPTTAVSCEVTPAGLAGTSALGTAVGESAGQDVLLRKGTDGKFISTVFTLVQSPTTLTATAALGTATSTATTTQSPTGLAGTGQLGTATVRADHTEAITGLAGTGHLGTPTSSTADFIEQAAPSLVATTALGTIIVRADHTEAITGLAGTGALGTADGAATNANQDVLLRTGASASVQSPAQLVLAVTPTGVAATGQLGTPTTEGAGEAFPAGFGMVASLSGAVESLGSTITPPSLAGTTALGTPATTGQAAENILPTGLVGTMGLGTPVTAAGTTLLPTGYGLTASLGTLAALRADHTEAVTGLAGTSALGSVVYAVHYRPTGLEGVTALGVVTASTAGDIEELPTGFGATASLGTPTDTVTAFTIDGVQGTGALGTPTAAITLQNILVEGLVGTTGLPQVSLVIPEFNTDNPASRWVAPTNERNIMPALRRLENQIGRTPLTYAHRLVFADATVRDSDQMLLVATTQAAVTITLPGAKSVLGRQFTMVKTTADANNVTVQGTGGETINGAATVVWNNQFGGQTFMACQINIPAVFGWVLLV